MSREGVGPKVQEAKYQGPQGAGFPAGRGKRGAETDDRSLQTPFLVVFQKNCAAGEKKTSRRRRKTEMSPQRENAAREEAGWGLKLTAGASLTTGPEWGTGEALAPAPGKFSQNSSEDHFVYI